MISLKRFRFVNIDRYCVYYSVKDFEFQNTTRNVTSVTAAYFILKAASSIH